MANIILTSYCNLHCPYCFADKMINTEDIKNISLNDFKKILYWVGEDRDDIGLIGGEPTLHPQFNEILKIVKEYSYERERPCMFTLFTNGIYLDNYIQNIPVNMGILLNVNQPQAMTTKQYSKMIKNIDTLYKLNWLNSSEDDSKVTLGCNICPQIDDYNFFWDIIKRFKIKRARISVTSPVLKDQQQNKEEYYNSMKNKFLDFIDQAQKNMVHLIYDCNQIPGCYFTKEELRKIEDVSAEDYKDGCYNCAPVVDITPDFKASSCFGAYELIDCKNFNNLNELIRYISYKVMYPKILNNCTGKCTTCKKYELMQCQGGCLAFSKKMGDIE